tara:strand:+ start:12393 stop:13724 length:1332 start_codon:yes stop_codon:yes gene_type:complete
MGLRTENILIVDDDYHVLELLQRHLQAWNFHVFKAISVKEAVSILKDSTIDLLITDLKLPEVDGFELLKFTTEHYPLLPKLVITGFPSVQDSLKAIKEGVVEYLTKPFTKEELKNILEKTLRNQARKTTQTVEDKPLIKMGEMIGDSAEMQTVFQIIERLKNNKATVFIRGESGTGKELVARAIHYQGNLANKPFIAVNCGGIPENLLESELFGYVKGAFTGADKNKDGFFQAANGGTIFLDEIGNAPMAVQLRLLRVLQEKKVLKLGAQKEEDIDLRVITATNGQLEEMIQKGSFREDLYYRLTVVEIKTPPLRNRKSDIPLLVEKFLLKYGLEFQDKFKGISPKALEILQRHNWPGNIRELENVIQRAVILSDKMVDVDNLPDELKYSIDFPKEKLMTLKEMEKQYIQKVLNHTQNNKTKAASILNIDRKTLREKLKENPE